MKPGLKKGKTSELQISEVYRIVSLIQRVNCSTFALVTETASELGIKKTMLMQYIEDNPKLFDVTEATSKSAKGVVKSLGLAIRKVISPRRRILIPRSGLLSRRRRGKRRSRFLNRLIMASMSYGIWQQMMKEEGRICGGTLQRKSRL